jgi:hypothetical protein
MGYCVTWLLVDAMDSRLVGLEDWLTRLSFFRKRIFSFLDLLTLPSDASACLVEELRPSLGASELLEGATRIESLEMLL